jgi:Recombination enhancement, RecA-dependent nuclease
MHSKSKPPTKVEKKRFQEILARGCCACLTYHDESLINPEVHHLLDGGVRRGHEFTVCLCAWHHRGVPPSPVQSVKEATELFGPSLYHDGKAFHAVFGDNSELLAFQESILRH